MGERGGKATRVTRRFAKTSPQAVPSYPVKCTFHKIWKGTLEGGWVGGAFLPYKCHKHPEGGVGVAREGKSHGRKHRLRTLP